MRHYFETSSWAQVVDFGSNLAVPTLTVYYLGCPYFCFPKTPIGASFESVLS